MIRDEQIPELKQYKDLERHLPISVRDDLAPMVVFGQNAETPIHNWFRFKEGFSASLLSTLLGECRVLDNKVELSILDPFSGVGTTLLSAQSLTTTRVRAFGIERNPFIHFVAETKLAWPMMNEESFMRDASAALRSAEKISVNLPSLSSIATGRCISKHTARRLVGLNEAVQQHEQNSQFLRLGLAAAVEPLSRVRRDGRALRLVDRPRRTIDPFLSAIWNQMIQDVKHERGCRGSQFYSSIALGDGRKPIECGIKPNSIDLIVTSPPYPNNIDYSEVYKLELWLLGFVNSEAEFLGLRHSTLRSHPTYDRSAGISNAYLAQINSGKLGNALGALLERLETSNEGWRAKLLKGYFSDLWSALEEYSKVLKENGLGIFVVGNSLHGSHNPALVATDLVLATMAECLGFEVMKIDIARGFRRRLSGNHFLRESVVIIRKAAQ